MNGLLLGQTGSRTVCMELWVMNLPALEGACKSSPIRDSLAHLTDGGWERQALGGVSSFGFGRAAHSFAGLFSRLCFFWVGGQHGYFERGNYIT